MMPKWGAIIKGGAIAQCLTSNAHYSKNRLEVLAYFPTFSPTGDNIAKLATAPNT
ncbi:hypothetical protein LC608_34445 [Nostoc sp. XA010]|uniref:hypothetical protein n=1 Tax=Nostoc sp. XA010 TaxID=2780407 RepID=UPI001E3DC8C9|nr:hypothetical protein [Nostoc sp. XA010]MCC5661949.1 hypothetical protein [Nostoc sp. XA010]